MGYKPKIVAGKVKDTGYPIDGRVIYFVMWDYDREFWRFYGWDEANDHAVMRTMYEMEREDGICAFETFDSFAENWKAGKWRPREDYAFPLDKVEVVEIKQEEEPNATREKMLAAGFDLSPRKSTDRGGILCLPLDENLNGDVQAKHPDWQPTTCPICGRKCWKQKEVDRLRFEQGVKIACTACAIEAELIAHHSDRRTRRTRTETGLRGGRQSVNSGKSNKRFKIKRFVSFLFVLAGRSKLRRRIRKNNRRIIRQAKAAGVWEKPEALGGKALELKAWQDYKIKRKPGETDACLRIRCKSAKLDQIAKEDYKTTRFPGETDEQLQERLKEIIDSNTPRWR